MSDEIGKLVSEAVHEALEELGFKGNQSIAMSTVDDDEECRSLAADVYAATQRAWIPSEMADKKPKLLAFRNQVRELAKSYM